jgi:hypothetical protein
VTVTIIATLALRRCMSLARAMAMMTEDQEVLDMTEDRLPLEVTATKATIAITRATLLLLFAHLQTFTRLRTSSGNAIVVLLVPSLQTSLSVPKLQLPLPKTAPNSIDQTPLLVSSPEQPNVDHIAGTARKEQEIGARTALVVQAFGS